MRRIRRNQRAACVTVVAMALLPLACEDEIPPEQRVASLAAVDGDGQQAAVTTALPRALVMRAVDTNGSPVGGATVEWQVTGGGGSVLSTAARTDRDGQSTATWTLGTAAGEQTVTVRVGVASFVFRATATPGPATRLTLTPPALALDAIGATGAFAVVAADAHGNPITGRAASWTSLNAGVATVDQAGRVTATGPGTGRIRVTLESATAEAEVVVAPVVTAVSVTPPNSTLNAVGATVQLQATPRDRNGNAVAGAAPVVWSSVSPAIASVSPTGLVTAQSVGVAQIRAASGAVVGQATVTVAPVAVSLVLSPRVDTLRTATPTRQIDVEAKDVNGNVIPNPQVTWTTSAPALASVSTTGLVTGLSNGTAIIRAQSGSARDSVTIVVRLNTPPKAFADTIGVNRNTQRVVAPPGLLANDSLGIPAAVIASFGGGSLPGTAATNAAGSTANFAGGGALRVDADGGLTFTPPTDFTGLFTFNYRAQNAAGFADATVTLEIGAFPVALNDTLETTVDTPLELAAPGLLANDTVGFPVATIVSFGGGNTVGGTAASFPAGNPVAFNIGGRILINANGSASFTPPTGFVGTFTVRYRLESRIGSSDATLVIHVNPPPPANRE